MFLSRHFTSHDQPLKATNERLERRRMANQVLAGKQKCNVGEKCQTPRTFYWFITCYVVLNSYQRINIQIFVCGRVAILKALQKLQESGKNAYERKTTDTKRFRRIVLVNTKLQIITICRLLNAGVA